MLNRLFLLALLGTLFCSTYCIGQGRNSGQVPLVLGVSDTIKSSILGEVRTLSIYLPEGYSPDSATRYPVIYLLDGGVDEDFIHIVGLVRYNTTPWINRFPKSIVVGIESINRRKDFTFSVPNLDFVPKVGFKKSLFPQYGGSEKFMAFLEQELQPFIDSRYATMPKRTIIGESLGGLLATEILLKKPALFDTYIILSPSLWWGEEILLKQAAGYLKSTTVKRNVYVGACQKAEDVRMFNDASALAVLLKQQPADSLRVIFDYMPTETHATIIHQGVYNAFKLLYPIK